MTLLQLMGTKVTFFGETITGKSPPIFSLRCIVGQGCKPRECSITNSLLSHFHWKETAAKRIRYYHGRKHSPRTMERQKAREHCRAACFPKKARCCIQAEPSSCWDEPAAVFGSQHFVICAWYCCQGSHHGLRYPRIRRQDTSHLPWCLKMLCIAITLFLNGLLAMVIFLLK